MGRLKKKQLVSMSDIFIKHEYGLHLTSQTRFKRKIHDH